MNKSIVILAFLCVFMSNLALGQDIAFQPSGALVLSGSNSGNTSGNFNLNAVVSGISPIANVQFYVNGTLHRSEGTAPYYMCGDNSGVPLNCPANFNSGFRVVLARVFSLGKNVYNETFLINSPGNFSINSTQNNTQNVTQNITQNGLSKNYTSAAFLHLRPPVGFINSTSIFIGDSLQNATGASMRYNAWDIDAVQECEFRFNSNMWTQCGPLYGNDVWRQEHSPIPLSWLASGANLLEFKFASNLGGTTSLYRVRDFVLTVNFGNGTNLTIPPINNTNLTNVTNSTNGTFNDTNSTINNTNSTGNSSINYSRTVVSFSGSKILVNGNLTNKGTKAEGIVYMIRAVNNIFDTKINKSAFDDFDQAGQTSWAANAATYGAWSAEANTNRFVAALGEWKANNITGFTMNLQGGCHCSRGLNFWTPPNGTDWWIENTPYVRAQNGTISSLDPAYMARAKKVLDRADELKMVVVLGVFYGNQDEFNPTTKDRNDSFKLVVNWLKQNNYSNVILEVANEIKTNSSAPWPNLLLKSSDGITDIPVSYSLYPGNIPPSTGAYMDHADVIMLHGNGIPGVAFGKMIDDIKAMPSYQANPRPIMVTEDNTIFRYDNLDNATMKGASWALYNSNYKQTSPANWSLFSMEDKRFSQRINFWLNQPK